MSFQNLSRQLDIVAAPFPAKILGAYTLTATDVSLGHAFYGMTAGTNLYSFVEQVYDPTTGLYVTANPGRQTANANGLAGNGQSVPITIAPSSGWAFEKNNLLMGTGGPVFVEMRTRGMAIGQPTYEFQQPQSITYQTASLTSYTLTTSWANAGLSVVLPVSTTWLITVQLNGNISPSASGQGDSISCRLYDGSTVYGEAVEFTYAVCNSVTMIAAAPLTAIVGAGAISALTLNVQAIINTSTASTGTLFNCYLTAVRLS